MSKVDEIIKILNERYDKRTINNPSIYGIAVINLSEEVGLLPSVIKVAISMWSDGLL